MSVQYRVYVTPLYSTYTYGSEVEISDYVEDVSGTITSSIDSTDFSVGIFTYNDVQLTCDNANGKLSDSSDSRSMFLFSRDRAKIRIVFDQGDGSPTTTYRGIINDSATTVSSDTDEIVLTLLGPDSVLANSVIPYGTVSSLMTASQALLAILNTGDVRSVLGVSVANINPATDVAIDDGTKFDKLNKKDAITKLLNASNSVMLIDSSLNVIIQNRSHSLLDSTVFLYGKGDQYGRENIISIQSYNTGLQRVFNSALVTGGTPTVTISGSAVAQVPTVASAQNYTSQSLYGLRQKALTVDFITDEGTLQDIAQSYVNEFSFAKLELEVRVSTALVASRGLLDTVSINYPLLVTPSGKFLPVVGVTVIGDTDSPLPYTKGAISIDPSIALKIIEKTEDISTYETTLKLRQIGTGLNDGRQEFLSTEAGSPLETESGIFIETEST